MSEVEVLREQNAQLEAELNALRNEREVGDAEYADAETKLAAAKEALENAMRAAEAAVKYEDVLREVKGSLAAARLQSYQNISKDYEQTENRVAVTMNGISQEYNECVAGRLAAQRIKLVLKAAGAEEYANYNASPVGSPMAFTGLQGPEPSGLEPAPTPSDTLSPAPPAEV